MSFKSLVTLNSRSKFLVITFTSFTLCRKRQKYGFLWLIHINVPCMIVSVNRIWKCISNNLKCCRWFRRFELWSYGSAERFHSNSRKQREISFCFPRSSNWCSGTIHAGTALMTFGRQYLLQRFCFLPSVVAIALEIRCRVCLQSFSIFFRICMWQAVSVAPKFSMRLKGVN